MPKNKIRETDLAKPVAYWLRSKGYVVYSEIAFHNRCIDMVGLKEPDNIRVVELKLRYGRGGLRQAMLCQTATKDVYLAVGKRPKDSSLLFCQKYGVGVVLVNATVRILSSPKQVVPPTPVLRKHLIDNCRETEPSDIAGLACMSGCGPAQAIGVLVKEYVKKNPKAGWKEIYLNIPNHYSNYRSMACAMSCYLGLSLTKLRDQ